MSGHKDRMTRKRKQDRGVSPTNSYGGDMYGINEWVLNDEQKALRELIYTKDIVFCDSKAGVGKSSSILYSYVEQYLRDKYKKIVIIRQPVEVGGSNAPSVLVSYSEADTDKIREALTRGDIKGKLVVV